MKYFFSIFLLLFSFFVFSSEASATLSFNGGDYTNMCGSGLAATNHACSGSCNPTTGTCSNTGSTVVKFVCDGKVNQCNQNESAFSSTQSLDYPGCNKSVAIVVFNKTCRQNGAWTCTDNDMKDYMVWYSGACQGATTAPTSTPTPTNTCNAQQLVQIQFQRSGTSTWMSGNNFTNQKIQKNEQININCFAKSGTALLSGGYIDMTDPLGRNRRVSDTAELRNFTVEASGTYAFTCKSATINQCTIADSFQVQGVNAPTPTPIQSQPPQYIPAPAPQQSSCDNLELVSGNNSLVPASVVFRARGSDNKGSIQRYRYYFGDGQQSETEQAEITHQYNVSGNLVARVDVKDSKGNWKTSSNCETTVTVKPAPVESFKSDCSNIYISADNSSRAPSTVKYEVSGYDNKGNIQAYKLDFGNGIIKEGTGRSFEQKYMQAGTYEVRGYVKNSQGNWVGGDESCHKTVTIGSSTPLTAQPSTGTPTMLPIVGGVSGVIGLAVLSFKKRFATTW